MEWGQVRLGCHGLGLPVPFLCYLLGRSPFQETSPLAPPSLPPLKLDSLTPGKVPLSEYIYHRELTYGCAHTNVPNPCVSQFHQQAWGSKGNTICPAAALNHYPNSGRRAQQADSRLLRSDSICMPGSFYCPPRGGELPPWRGKLPCMWVRKHYPCDTCVPKLCFLDQETAPVYDIPGTALCFLSSAQYRDRKTWEAVMSLGQILFAKSK